MLPDEEMMEKGLLIVTGSNLRAEKADRPLAYRLKNTIEERLNGQEPTQKVVVLSDLWYLNGETLQELPMISVGGPGVNAVSAYLYKQLSNALVVDDTLVIQMDVTFKDLRACVWGTNHELTVNALDLFIEKLAVTNINLFDSAFDFFLAY